ncbi:DNA modification methylase [Thermoactinomyces sp. DSM 45891]|uniref:site-specific DNA-methyltransferase n=1 Tax=Thermoactinomyces sp. DSM 45891 TaxID=1761907 RepID=UPI0009126A53|nr:site-specific DNA-methyltransferase [Thermoactinomyces sp. DSM 45891]SFX82604.1 DNA modification methylase [Thermoactinomyces sp. DSM 45891]
MKIQSVSINQINPATYNPRLDLKSGDPEYEKLKKSIAEFGFVEPLIWNSQTGNLVGGHQRLKVLIEQGVTEVECSVVDLTEEKEKALNIGLNKVGGDWDFDKLARLLDDIQLSGIDMDLTGFGEEEVDQILSDFLSGMEPEEDDFDEEEAIDQIDDLVTQTGDIWLLGNHRLMCGDATMIDDVTKLMDGQRANMVFTDPPYNVSYTGKTSEALTIQNDSMNDDEFYQFLYHAFSNMCAVTEEGGGIYICHADTEGVNFRNALKNSGWELKQCLIWVKNMIVLGRSDYHWRHEPILYGWRSGASHNWYGDRKQSTVWEVDKPNRNGEHPTMKPIAIPAKAIQNSCKPRGIVLDLFSGSGSTLLAAEQTDRVCYGMELDPVYCDVIIRRWEEFTGQKATRLSGEDNYSNAVKAKVPTNEST